MNTLASRGLEEPFFVSVYRTTEQKLCCTYMYLPTCFKGSPTTRDSTIGSPTIRDSAIGSPTTHDSAIGSPTTRDPSRVMLSRQ